MEEQWESLGEDYRVEAAFILWASDRMLQILASALFRERGKLAVFVIERGFARKRLVTVGHSNGLAAELLSGLAKGESVIPYPEEKLTDGLAVKLTAVKK